jgi:putative solute:sodium symporter small subunit
MPDPSSDAVLRARWRACMVLTAWLLAIGAGVTFGIAWFARALDAQLLGWPFSFWVAAQGAPVLYLALVCFYARAMRRLDQRYATGEDA